MQHSALVVTPLARAQNGTGRPCFARGAPTVCRRWSPTSWRMLSGSGTRRGEISLRHPPRKAVAAAHVTARRATVDVRTRPSRKSRMNRWCAWP